MHTHCVMDLCCGCICVKVTAFVVALSSPTVNGSLIQGSPHCSVAWSSFLDSSLEFTKGLGCV